jgi:hypothetical protein
MRKEGYFQASSYTVNSESYEINSATFTCSSSDPFQPELQKEYWLLHWSRAAEAICVLPDHPNFQKKNMYIYI